MDKESAVLLVAIVLVLVISCSITLYFDLFYEGKIVEPL
jgi:hypothetical protein